MRRPSHDKATRVGSNALRNLSELGMGQTLEPRMTPSLVSQGHSQLEHGRHGVYRSMQDPNLLSRKSLMKDMVGTGPARVGGDERASLNVP